MFVLCTYVPETHVEKVKAALFAAGAGRLGNYDRCVWQTKGVGQFRPLSGSDPFLGEEGQSETVGEWKLEVVVSRADAQRVLAALKDSHPYETPAYHFIAVDCEPP